MGSPELAPGLLRRPRDRFGELGAGQAGGLACPAAGHGAQVTASAVVWRNLLFA